MGLRRLVRCLFIVVLALALALTVAPTVAPQPAAASDESGFVMPTSLPSPAQIGQPDSVDGIGFGDPTAEVEVISPPKPNAAPDASGLGGEITSTSAVGSPKPTPSTLSAWPIWAGEGREVGMTKPDSSLAAAGCGAIVGATVTTSASANTKKNRQRSGRRKPMAILQTEKYRRC